jgi:glycine hydroxymethyltransferase
VDVAKIGGGTPIVEDMEKANIIANKNLLPWDDTNKAMNPSGVRLGVQELTRIGFKEGDMVDVAQIFKELAIDKSDPLKIKEKVIDLRKGFKSIHYCFHEGKDPYEYHEFV